MKKSSIKFNFVAYSFLIFFTLVCLFPFLLIISGSITAQESIFRDGYRLIPVEFSLDAYKVVFENPKPLMRAYGVTICVTLIGTLASLFVSSMAAYVLSNKNFKYRNVYSFLFYFTTIFGGGLVPWYIMMVRYLDMKNNYLALILPIFLNAVYIIIMRSFIQSSVPFSLVESAKLDGAGYYMIYQRIVLPIIKPALATIGLFTALAYWNDWYNAMLFIDNTSMYPLQYYLHAMLSKADFMKNVASQSGIPSVNLPSESMKLAMTVITTGPIILLYPFLQPFFVKGITIGAVKG